MKHVYQNFTSISLLFFYLPSKDRTFICCASFFNPLLFHLTLKFTSLSRIASITSTVFAHAMLCLLFLASRFVLKLKIFNAFVMNDCILIQFLAIDFYAVTYLF